MSDVEVKFIAAYTNYSLCLGRRYAMLETTILPLHTPVPYAFLLRAVGSPYSPASRPESAARELCTKLAV